MFVLSLGAEFIANDKPIVASYKGEILFPFLHDYPEDKFGGFLAETDYRDPVVANEIDRQRLDGVAADPLLLQHPQPRPAGAGALAADLAARATRNARLRSSATTARRRRADPCRAIEMELARHRRPGPRRAWRG